MKLPCPTFPSFSFPSPSKYLPCWTGTCALVSGTTAAVCKVFCWALLDSRCHDQSVAAKAAAESTSMTDAATSVMNFVIRKGTELASRNSHAHHDVGDYKDWCGPAATTHAIAKAVFIVSVVLTGVTFGTIKYNRWKKQKVAAAEELQKEE